MRIEQLEYVLTVARYGSLSRASTTIFVGQPTLSAAIAAFEKELGHAIFKRTRRGMVLTPTGEDLLPLIEKTVDDFYALKKRAGAGSASLAHIHLLCAYPCRNVLCDSIIRAQTIFPLVHFYMHNALANDIPHQLVNKEVTLGLSFAFDYHLRKHREYVLSNHLRFLPLYNDALVLFVKSGGKHNKLTQCQFSDLGEIEHVALPCDLIHQGVIKTHSNWAELPRHLAFDDSDTLMRYVEQTDAIGVTSSLSTLNNPYFTTGHFKTVPLLGSPIHMVHYLTYSKEHSVTDEEAELIQQIEGYYERLSHN